MQINDRVTFADEPESPYTVKAVSSRYAILTRPATAEDVVAFEHEGPLEGNVIYTIVDFDSMMRGPNYYVFNMYDYTKQADIDRCLTDLDGGKCEVSRRRSVQFQVLAERQR